MSQKFAILFLFICRVFVTTIAQASECAVVPPVEEAYAGAGGRNQ